MPPGKTRGARTLPAATRPAPISKPTAAPAARRSFEIHDHVLPEIGQLQRRTGGVGKSLPGFVPISAQSQHQAPHRIRGIAAVLKQRLEIAIARHGLILLKRGDQIVKKPPGQLMPPGRIFERHEHGMRRASRVHAVKLVAPPLEQAQTFGGVADLIA
jgi:hypothetical protein